MAKDDSETKSNNPLLLPLSANGLRSLYERTKAIQGYLSGHPEAIRDLAYTLSARREHLRHRAFAVTGNDPADYIQFKKAENEKPGPRIVTFAFPGQGVQWAGMGTELIDSFASFREDIQRMDEVLQELSNAPTWRIRGSYCKPPQYFCSPLLIGFEEELAKTGQDSGIGRPEIAQPLCTAVQIGLVNILRGWNITPDKVIGHSSGEFAAAYAANALSMESAIILAYTRGMVAKMAPEGGGMLAVALSRAGVSQYLNREVVLACENSPSSVTLSGNRGQLEQVATRIREDLPDTLLKLLPVERAYHSG